jgi:hypothetical protein
LESSFASLLSALLVADISDDDSNMHLIYLERMVLAVFIMHA